MTVVEQKEKESTVLPAFISVVEELLNGLHEVFPECDKVKKRLLKFRAFVKSPDVLNEQRQIIEEGKIKSMEAAQMLIKDWHSQMAPFYEAIRNRDLDTLLQSDLRVVSELDLQIKWQDPEFDAESRESLMQFLDSLNMYAQMYCSIPNKMMSKIEGVAQQLAQRMASGETSLASLDIFKLGESIIKDTTEEELAQFAGSMGDIQKMMNLQMANMPQESIPGMPDMGNMMKMMSSMMKMTQQ